MKGDSKLLLQARLAETRNTLERQKLLKEIWHLERLERQAEEERERLAAGFMGTTFKGLMPSLGNKVGA
jgi:hypothetical protein